MKKMVNRMMKVSLLTTVLFVSAVSMAFAADEKNGQVVIEAESYTKIVEVDTNKWEKVAAKSGDGMLLTPDENFNWVDESDALSGTAPELAYEINFSTAGTYTVWVMINAPHQGSDSMHLGLNDKYIASNKALVFHETEYYWNNIGAITIDSAGKHTLNLWPREDGMTIDRIFLTTANLTDAEVGAKADAAAAGPAPAQGGDNTAAPVENPKTGDNGITLYVVMAIVAGAAALYLTRRKRA